MASPATLTAPNAEEFRRQRRRKRTNSSEEAGLTSGKKQGWSKKSYEPVATRLSVIPAHNYFAPFRIFEVDSISTASDEPQSELRTQQ
jgi:hypothetical protein